jgi:hypothetical protein
MTKPKTTRIRSKSRPPKDAIITTATSLSPEPLPRYSDEDTHRRIRAYLASVQPLRGNDVDDDKPYHQGRALLEYAAFKSVGLGHDYPKVRLTLAECAKVLHFMSRSEPLEPHTWWDDPKEGPSPVVGFHMVLDTLARSLRAKVRR